MALNMREMWLNGIKIAFFFQKIAQQLGAPPPDPPSVTRFSYSGFLKTSPKLRICSFQL